MKWTVVYRPDAADELAEIWMNATDRSAVAKAANSMDRLLATDPQNAGESRDGDSRVLLETPLVAFFDVSPLDYCVYIWRIHLQR